jgi:poly-gamma-glutamate synthesis protein (capsule biosynthesis protein)
MRRSIAAFVFLSVALAAHPAAPRQAPDAFTATITRIDRETRELMRGRSWRPRCPVGFRDLRLVRLTYLGFDRESHMGELVVHRRWADEIVRVFRRMYEVRFRIRRMRLVDHYGAEDRRSMAADNTSAFNCRWRAGVCCRWSQHAYGRAIDINPVENPFVWDGGFSPPAGEAFLDRSNHRKGMIYRHDAVWWAFHAVGWDWGGDWDLPDYQHFSANGR